MNIQIKQIRNSCEQLNVKANWLEGQIIVISKQYYFYVNYHINLQLIQAVLYI